MHNAIIPPNPMDELEKNLKQAEGQQLTKQERRLLKKERKEEERKSERRKRSIKKILNISAVVLIVGGVIFGLGWWISNQPKLPPTTAQGHTEDMPQSHITDQPISDSMQRHMLEHSDGKGKPGIIIQYNCKDYSCEPDLIQKLKALAEKYPDNVYLAPNSYDGKIILTKLGKSKVLENFDEQAIKDFIE